MPGEKEEAALAGNECLIHKHPLCITISMCRNYLQLHLFLCKTKNMKVKYLFPVKNGVVLFLLKIFLLKISQSTLLLIIIPIFEVHHWYLNYITMIIQCIGIITVFWQLRSISTFLHHHFLQCHILPLSMHVGMISYYFVWACEQVISWYWPCIQLMWLPVVM